MTTFQSFKDLPLWAELETSGLDALTHSAEELEMDAGEVVTQQFSPTKYFYLLIDGHVEFSIKLEEMNQPLIVGTSNEEWTPMGWSGFRSPYRYATTVTTLVTSRVLRWSHADLRELFENDRRLAMSFLFFVAERSGDLLREVRKLIGEFNKVDWNKDTDLLDEPHLLNPKRPVPDLRDLMRQSPFFEIFPEKTLQHLFLFAKERRFARGEVIRKQGDFYDSFLLLGTGKLVYHYQDESNPQAVPVRSLSSPGYVVSWLGCVYEAPQDTTIIALKDCTLFEFDRKAINSYIQTNSKFGLAFAYRLLWLTGNYLRAARAQLISQRFEKEIVSVGNLIEQNCTQLSVLSPLHKVPHLLSHTYTLGDAFNCLIEVINQGSSVERGVAQLCLDILGNVRKEYRFFDGLQQVYQSVVDAPEHIGADEIRKMSAEKFIKAFETVPFKITGWENLPDKPGHIFIYNHLMNHKFNTLPNNFQLTLDSHFISAMISHKKYGDPGVRVVRIGKGVEYGHQNYYGRLGHIDVFTAESEKSEATKEAREQKRQAFFKEANSFLKNGTNLILSPEGTSYRTEESPGLFKSGAFRLAHLADSEPFIVPIAVANFDKRIHHTTFSVVIQQPFKISDVVSNPEDKEEMYDWLKGYQAQFKGFVQEAVEAARKD